MSSISAENNRETWIDEKNLQEATWLHRAKLASLFVRDGESVIDLGCGKQLPRRFIEGRAHYTPCDISQRTPDTIVCDFERKEFPDGKYDVALLLGVLEFIPDIDFIFQNLSKSVKKVVFSYCMSPGKGDFITKKRDSYRFRTNFMAEELDEILRENKFKLMHSRVISKYKFFNQILCLATNNNFYK